MRNAPTDKARAAALATRKTKQADSVERLRDRAQHLLQQVESGSAERDKLTAASIFEFVGVSKAKFYRTRKGDEELDAICSKLWPKHSGSTSEEATPPLSDSDDDPERVVNLMMQVATAKAFIAMLEMERKSLKKDLKSNSASMAALQRQVTKLAGLVHDMHQFMINRGIHFELSQTELATIERAPDRRPDLHIVRDDT